MPRDVARDSLYNGRINLWVEDDLTRAYLGRLWNDPAVKFLIGGGRDGVKAILKDAEEAGYTNVFGVVDRDHASSNYNDWLVPGRTSRRFILPRHEIENYLLDTAALEGCRFNTHRRTIAEIDTYLNSEAEKRSWSAAGCHVVSHLRDRFFDKFVGHPKMPPVDSEDAARKHITQSSWFLALPHKSANMIEDRVHRLLARAHRRTQRLLADGKWRVEFSGKEIFHEIGNRIFNRILVPRNNILPPAQLDADIAKTIADWQVANGVVPAELTDLLTALRRRIQP